MHSELSFFQQCKKLPVGAKLEKLETKGNIFNDVLIRTQYYDAKQLEIEEVINGRTHLINYSDVTKITMP